MRGSLGRIYRSVGPDDESDEMNVMKKMGMDHRTWIVGSKMDLGGRLDRLDESGGHDGDREVRADKRLMVDGQNGSATIGS